MASPAQQRGPPRLGNKVSMFPIPSLSRGTALHPRQRSGSYSPYPNPRSHRGQSMAGDGPGLELSLHRLAALHRARRLRGAALTARGGHLLTRLLVTGLAASRPGRR